MKPSSHERPLVSFLILAYNQEKYIRKAVSGAFSQTYEPLEIVLSDDCSHDKTFEIMQEMADKYNGPHTVRIIQNAINLGLAEHINHRIEDVNGSIVSWAAGDDIAMPQRTDVLVHELLLNSKTVAAHSAILEIDRDGFELGKRSHPLSTKNIGMDTVLRDGRSVVTQSMAFRKEVFVFFGPFRDDLTHEGKAMAFRLVSSGEVRYVDQPLTKYRIGSGISTYSGSDIDKLKYSEPIKVTSWYLSSYHQMLDDSKKLAQPLDDKKIGMLNDQLLFFENLKKVNDGLTYITPVLRNLRLRPFSSATIRAALRSWMPKSLYGVFLRNLERYK